MATSTSRISPKITIVYKKKIAKGSLYFLIFWGKISIESWPIELYMLFLMPHFVFGSFLTKISPKLLIKPELLLSVVPIFCSFTSRTIPLFCIGHKKFWKQCILIFETCQSIQESYKHSNTRVLLISRRKVKNLGRVLKPKQEAPLFHLLNCP